MFVLFVLAWFPSRVAVGFASAAQSGVPCSAAGELKQPSQK